MALGSGPSMSLGGIPHSWKGHGTLCEPSAKAVAGKGHLPILSWPASALKGLAKARLCPAAKLAAKAAGQAPAKQEASKKRSCSSASFTQGGESATLRKGAPILASLRNASTKRRRSPEEPRALPLRPISVRKQRSDAARAQSPARRGCLKYIAGFSPRRRHTHEGA